MKFATAQMFLALWLIESALVFAAYLVGVRNGHRRLHEEMADAVQRRLDWQQPVHAGWQTPAVPTWRLHPAARRSRLYDQDCPR